MNTADREQATSQQEDRLLDAACRSLDDSIDSLDGATLSRLNQARQAALASRPQSLLGRFWLPAGGIAFTVLVLATALPHNSGQPSQPAVETGIEEVWTSSAADVQLLEDLDLVLWLMDEEDHAS